MQKITLNGKEVNLVPTTGKVLNANKNMETKVSGSGGGGSTFRGTGYNAPVTIKSTTTVHDQFFLEDKEGREHAFQLTDFDLACRDGNTVTVLSAFKQEKKTGHFIVVVNHSTGKTYYNEKSLQKISAPWLIPYIGGFIVAMFLFIKLMEGSTAVVTLFILFIALLIYYTVTMKKNVKFVKASVNPSLYV